MRLTAHDLAAGFDWSDADGFRLRGGRTVWEDATYLEGGQYSRVRIARLVPATRTTVRQINRWVDPDTEVELVYRTTASNG